MRSLFRSKFQITQAFGVNAEYYKQFGLKAHEGLDLIPTGTVWDVLCLADGVVVKDEDNAVSGAYGKYVTVWHPTLNKATQYCHLSDNYVSLGDKVTTGQKLGIMGKTGNSTGPHLHLNLFDVDANGVRLNRDNGYLGGIDPLPFLNEDVASQPATPDEIVVRADAFIAVCTELGVTTPTKDNAIAKVKGMKEQITQLEDINQEKERQKQDLSGEVAELKKQVVLMAEENKKLQENYLAATQVAEANDTKIADFTKKIETLESKIKVQSLSPLGHILIGLKGLLRW